MKENSVESGEFSLRNAGVVDSHDELRRINSSDGESVTSSDSNDPEYHELQERSQIVERYEKGPEQEVEEWENPDLEIYKLTDRYGFVNKNNPTDAVKEKILLERKRIEKETSREQKWLKMMTKPSERKKFQRRVWKGIPEKLRSIIWIRLLNIDQFKQNSGYENVYKELLMRARLISRDIKQIDLDINRTYRDHLAFRRRYDIKQQSLFNVLCAYAMYNTEVGYCQGMSQIAALFLMYMDEEDAFWCLHALFVNEKHSMHGFFIPNFPKLVRFQTIYDKILQYYLPRLKKHLDKAEILPIYLTKWWFGCFLDRIPFPLALRLWDVFLLEGDVILLAMAYNIMKMHEKSIRKLRFEDFMDFIQSKISKDYGFSDEEVFRSLQECLSKLQKDEILNTVQIDAREKPHKPFGPTLSRSMIDIRFDIAEIQSRHSRANSLASRSPMVSRLRQHPFSILSPGQLQEKFQTRSKISPNDSNSHSSSTVTESTIGPVTNISTKYKTDGIMVPTIGEGSSTKFFHHESMKDRGNFVEVDRHPFEYEGSQSGLKSLNSEIKAFPNKYGTIVDERAPNKEMRYKQQGLVHEPIRQISTKNISMSNYSRERPDILKFSTRNQQIGKLIPLSGSPQTNVYEEPEIDYETETFSSENNRGVYSNHIVDVTYPLQSSSPNRWANLPNPNRSIASEFSSRLPPRAKSSRSNTRKGFNQVVENPNEMKQFSNIVDSKTNLMDSGQLLYGSKIENHSMERRFRHGSTSPTLLETKREQTITEVEARVIQLPNNITYVNVGDPENTRKVSSQPRKPDVSHYSRNLGSRSVVGESSYKSFQSQFRDNIHYNIGGEKFTRNRQENINKLEDRDLPRKFTNHGHDYRF